MDYVLKRRLISVVGFLAGFPFGVVGTAALQESLVGPEGVAGNPMSAMGFLLMGILFGFLGRSIALIATGTVDASSE